MLLLELLILLGGPLFLMLLLKDHMQVGANLMEEFGVFDLLGYFGDIIELPVESLLYKVDLLHLYVLPQDVDYLHFLGQLITLQGVQDILEQAVLREEVSVRTG